MAFQNVHPEIPFFQFRSGKGRPRADRIGRGLDAMKHFIEASRPEQPPARAGFGADVQANLRLVLAAAMEPDEATEKSAVQIIAVGEID